MHPLKILHTADWHIGSFPSPASKSKANLRFLDICAYIEFLISEAKTRQPDIIIIAGDVFHQAKTWSDRGLQETKEIIRYITALSEIAPVCVLRGTPNHDGKTHYDLLSTALGNRNNIHIVDEPCVKNINNLAAVTFVPIFDKNSYRAESENTMDKEAENNYFCDKVRDAILNLKPQADAMGLPTILVTHYTVLGATLPNGQTSIFANQETVIDPLTLIQSDYWLCCLGHIHKPQRLDVCPNAFYSGSLCALTFNDEHDPHGFYMHTINNRHDIVSEFIETPSRRFRTIYLDDTQLNDIIAKDYNLTGYADASMCGDIVRIIYSCTDTTNKMLNKALLEKALYNFSEAFYVQEIIPSDIVITVDKTAMSSTTSIVDNLYTFLYNEKIDNKTIDDTQIQDCLQLANPIIDKFLADRQTNSNIGIFTPIEIEVKNYRNYKHAVFNYSDIQFCVINGDNGAGKSSLFMDAMLDAIFEETREGDITGWINNNVNVRSGSIKFTFSIGDNIYKITRTRQKSGKATLNIAQFVTDADGVESWIDLSEEKIRDTQAVINKIVGMDALTLKSCGLIMQDAYGLFLQADKTTRMDILGNILGLGIYNDLCEGVNEYSLICQREISKINDEESTILATLKNGDEIQTKLNEAYQNGSQYEHDAKKCSDDLEENIKRREAFVKAIEDYNRLSGEADALDLKMINLQKQLDEQNIILTNANAVTSRKTGLGELIRKRDALNADIKTISDKADQIALLMTLRKNIETEFAGLDNTVTDADKKIAAIKREKSTLEMELAGIASNVSNAERYEALKTEIAEIEVKLSQITALETELAAQNAILAEAKYTMSNQQVEYDTKNLELDRKIALLNESGCPIAEKATCKFLADAQNALSEKTALTAAYNEARANYVQTESKLNAKIRDITGKINMLKSGLPDIELKKQELSVCETSAFTAAKLPEIQKTIAAYEQQLTDFEQIKAENLKKHAEAIERINQNTQQISALTVETAGLDTLKAELASIGDLDALRNEIAANEATEAAATARITEITDELRAIGSERSNKLQERSQIPIDNIEVSEIDTNILACKTQLELLNKNIAENGKIIGLLEQDMTAYKQDVRRLDKIKVLKNKMAYTASNAGWLKKAFSRSGIPHNIIRSIIPILETTASNILNQMSANTMSITLQTEKMLTTKKEVATLDVIVCDTVTGDLPYLSRSGGERVKAALSVILALAEIKSSESGTQLGFLFIDEPPFLDSNGTEAYCDALEAIRTRYSNLKIIAITHDFEMKSRFSQSIDIVKTPDGSEIHAAL